MHDVIIPRRCKRSNDMIPDSRLYMLPLQIHLLHYWRTAYGRLDLVFPLTPHQGGHLNWWFKRANMLKGRFLQQPSVSKVQKQIQKFNCQIILICPHWRRHILQMLVESPKRPPISSDLWKGAAVAEWLSSWLAEQEVRGSIPGLATWISEIDYLQLPSRDMAGISLNRRTNQPDLLSQPKQ